MAAAASAETANPVAGKKVAYIMLLPSATQLIRKWRPEQRNLYSREGYVIVAEVWVLVSLFGCLPFLLSGAIPHFVDAFFETVSGFTTTGASNLPDIEALGRGSLFWRSLTHFLGGMGVLVFILAVLPMSGSRSMHIMRAEVPGPIVGKLVPSARKTAIPVGTKQCVICA